MMDEREFRESTLEIDEQEQGRQIKQQLANDHEKLVYALRRRIARAYYGAFKCVYRKFPAP